MLWANASMHSCTHTHAPLTPPTHTCAHAHTHAHTHIHTGAHTHTHTTHSCTQTGTHTHTLLHTDRHTDRHTHTHTHTHTHSLLHTDRHTHTHTLSLSVSVSFPSVCHRSTPTQCLALVHRFDRFILLYQALQNVTVFFVNILTREQYSLRYKNTLYNQFRNTSKSITVDCMKMYKCTQIYYTICTYNTVLLPVYNNIIVFMQFSFQPWESNFELVSQNYGFCFVLFF